MTLMEAITARKSIRSYDMEPLDEEVLEGLVDFLSDLEPPEPGIDWNFDLLPLEDMCKVVNGVPRLQAPHYLVLRSEKIKGCLQNAGYLGEMAVLYLTTQGIATCWQGGLEAETDFDGVLPFIIAIAFGKSDEPFRTSPAEFKRKKLLSLVAGTTKGYRGPVFEAARLAPSSMGMEPIRYTSIDNQITVYRAPKLIKLPAISYMQCVDAGIAMAHLEIAAKDQGYRVRYEKLDPAPAWKKYVYQMTLTLFPVDGGQSAPAEGGD